MSWKRETVLGFPLVVDDSLDEGEIRFGRWPGLRSARLEGDEEEGIALRLGRGPDGL